MKELDEKIQKLMDKHTGYSQVDTSIFNDERAQDISWRPNRGGGASFKTHKFDKSETRRWVVKPTLRTYLFGAIFLSMGAGLGYFRFITPEEDNMVYLVAGMFVAAGLFIIFRGMKKTEIDFNRGRLLYGGKDYPFSSIMAIQIIQERIETRGSTESMGRTYYSYEFNVVLINGSRLTLMDHGDAAYIRKEAAEIATYLNCPVWDGSRRKRKRRKVAA